MPSANGSRLIYTYAFIHPFRETPKNEEPALKILVCMKQVPQKDAPLKLNESGTWIREDVS